MRVLIINGVARSGKDTLIDLFRTTTTSHVLNVSTIEPVKEVSKMLGWNGTSKTDADRLMWSRLKALWTEYNDGLFRSVTSWVHKESRNGYVFVHCREPQEIRRYVEHFRKTYGFCVSLLVRRGGLDVPDNPSDASVEDFEYDIIVDNNEGLKELRQSALTLKVALDNWGSPGHGQYVSESGDDPYLI